METSLARMEDLIARLAESQIDFNSSINGINARVENLELRMKKYPVSSGQKRDIRKHVKAAVSVTVSNNSWKYSDVSRMLFSAIYTEINDQYDVASYDDLPSVYYKEIIEKIDRWTPDPLTIERINKRIA